MRLNRDRIEIDINTLITICKNIQIIDDFTLEISRFKDLDKLEKDLNKLLKGKSIFNKKVKDFYIKYEELIKSIDTTHGLYFFLAKNFGKTLMPFTNYKNAIKYVEQYKDQSLSMLSLLMYIKELKYVNNVIIDPDNEFDHVFKIDTTANYFYEFGYGDNITYIPTYDKSDIQYNCKDSNFVIPIARDMYSFRASHHNSILVNNLVFNREALPLSLDPSNTIDVISKGYNENTSALEGLRELVNYSIAVNKLEDECSKLEDITDSLTSIKDKKELVEKLSYIKENITKLNAIYDTNKARIVSENEMLTDELIENETHERIRRIKESTLDLC